MQNRDDQSQSGNRDNKRRSKRVPKPNPIYEVGIQQLRNQSTKTKKKGKQFEQQEYNSYSEDKLQSKLEENYQQDVEGSETLYPCIIPNRQPMKIAIILQGKEKEQKNEEKVIKPEGGTNLLMLFQKAIVDVHTNMPNQNSEKKVSILEPLSPYVQQKCFNKKKDPTEGIVQKVNFNGQNLQIIHSQLGQINFDVQWTRPTKIKQEDTEEINSINFLREKLSTKHILPSILS